MDTVYLYEEIWMFFQLSSTAIFVYYEIYNTHDIKILPILHKKYDKIQFVTQTLQKSFFIIEFFDIMI